MTVTDEQIVRALSDAARVPAQVVSGQALLSGVRRTAERRLRRRTRVRVVASMVAFVVVGAGIWAVGYPPGKGERPSPTRPPSSSPALGFVPGEYGGVIADGLPPKLALRQPVSAVPLLPAAVRWGADAETLTRLSRTLYDVQPNGSVPATNAALLDGRNVRWVAFPFPAAALVQPSDLGSQPLYLTDSSVQTTGIRVQHEQECSRADESWANHRVAGVTLTLQSARTEVDSRTVATEVVGVFDGGGASSAFASAAATLACRNPNAARFTPVTVAAPVGQQVVAGLGRDTTDSTAVQTTRFLGIARVGAIVVAVDYLSQATPAQAARAGTALLRVAVTRLSSAPVHTLVARYVR